MVSITFFFFAPPLSALAYNFSAAMSLSHNLISGPPKICDLTMKLSDDRIGTIVCLATIERGSALPATVVGGGSVVAEPSACCNAAAARNAKPIDGVDLATSANEICLFAW